MRTLTPQLDAALRETIVRPALLWELLGHPAGDLRVWTGIGTLSYRGHAWKQGGIVVQATPHEDATEVRVVQHVLSLTLPDASPEVLAIIATPVKRLVINRYRAFLDANGQVIPDAILTFKGYTDTPKILDNDDGSRTVQLLISGAITQLVTPLRTMLSHEEQVALFPDDTGLSRMSSIQNQDLSWQVGTYNGFSPP